MIRACLKTTLAGFILFGVMGCSHLPGKPGFRAETMRPEQVHDFKILYQRNCSACHGDNGLNGAALPLNNPVYLAWAGHDRMVGIVSNGVPKSLMPAFGQGGGGLLTSQQVEDIVSGMISNWGKAGVLNGANAPEYTTTSDGNISQGQTAFQNYCASCHGANGEGMSVSKNSAQATGSIVDLTYLSLITQQGIRSIIVSGLPGENMLDWRRGVTGKSMTDGEVNDIVAWMESHREPGKQATAARSSR